MGSNEEKKVKDTLALFRGKFNKLSNRPKQEGQSNRRLDLEAADFVKRQGNAINQEKGVGHVPGIKIGDRFRYRAELSIIGLHYSYVSGIDHTKQNGKPVATSVVDSGRYANEAITSDVLIYCGQGKKVEKGKISHQELYLGNLALENSWKDKTPIRMIRKTKNNYGDSEFVYDGLYIVKQCWEEGDGALKFELHRTLNGQDKVHQRRGKEDCLVEDVSQGMEIFKVKAMNGIDVDKPGQFYYVTKNVYPEWWMEIEHAGCFCNDGCSECDCVLRNGGGLVYECGPSCKCPDSCPNRVSQLGPRYQLELFKVESNRWGVRSRNYISSGSFVCEYVGEIKVAYVQKVDHDDPSGRFCFPILKSNNNRQSDENEMGFVIDASEVGNVGRFIRHSKSPSLVVRHVLYDHGDVRMPHILFFAAKNIPPLRELTCDYEHY